MSQQHRRSKASENGGRGRAVALGVVVAAAVALGLLTWRSSPRTETPLPAPRARPASRATPPRAASTPSAPRAPVDPGDTPEAFRPLLDQWLRPDGGYVLSVTGIAEDGTASVGYFNPRPINVGRAEASLEDDVLGLFVELQDRNYPGSTYTLSYDAAGDQLVGVYFQATQRASYDVVFVRKR